MICVNPSPDPPMTIRARKMDLRRLALGPYLRQHRRMGRDESENVLRWLQGGGPFGREELRRIDTHGAVILLAGDRAWKLKKPVRFCYMDFSTAEKRHRALEAELRLNRRTAPQLYLGLHRVTRAADGRLALDGAGEVVDWLLEMRRFPDGALLEEQAAQGRFDEERLDDEPLIRELADHVAALHALADPVPLSDGAARLRRVVEGNADAMAAYPAILPEEQARRLTGRLRKRIDALAPLLDARGREGRIRHVHGDLHLGNIALVDGRPVAFDCLEFDADLATIDVLYDLAFLLMDLWQRGLAQAANRLLNRYLDLSPNDEGAMALLPLFMAVRASIRAHVLAARAEQAGEGPGRDEAAASARAYLDFALGLLDRADRAPPRLLAIGGLSGTGKSTLARLLGDRIGAPPGARILRSDVLRKRLAGVAPEAPLPPEAYTRDSSALVYGELARLAGTALDAGGGVIADAVFASPMEREDIRAVADRRGARFDGLWLVLPEEGRVARVERRRGDASDADAAVVRAQTLRHPDRPEDWPDDWTVLDADGNSAALAVRARAALGLAPEAGPPRQ